MALQFSPFMPLNVFIIILTASLATYAGLRYRQARKSSLLAFVGLMAAIIGWQIVQLAHSAVVSAELKFHLANLLNAVPAALELYAILWFALAYTDNDKWVTPWVVGPAVIHTVGLSIVLAVSPEFLYDFAGSTTVGPVTIFGVTFSEWVVFNVEFNLPFQLYQLYAYSIHLLVAAIFIRYTFRNRSDLYTGQVASLVIGIGAPIVINALVFARILPPGLNITDLGFGVTSIAFAVAIFRYQMLRVVPVGRQKVIEIMTDPVVMLNDDGRVVDCNNAALDLVDAPPGW